MLIIAIELLGVFRILKILKKHKMSFDYTVLISLLIQALIIVSYRIELSLINRTVYWADAEYYWSNTLEVINGIKGGVYYNWLYVYWSALIQVLSPFIWVGWNNISNSLLLSLATLYAARCLQMNGGGYKSIRRFIRSVLWNPLAIYALIRNLKDAFFLIEAVLIIYNYYSYRTAGKHLTYFFISVCLDISLVGIRPWGCLILVALMVADAVYSVVSAKYISIRMLLFSALSIMGFVCLLAVMYNINAFEAVETWTPIVVENAHSSARLSVLLAPLRMLTGPGVYRVIMGSQYAAFTTSVGNCCLILGCLLWWGWLTYFIQNIKQIRITKIGVFFIVVTMMHLGIYAMQYAGGTEHRMRAVAYLLSSASFFSNTHDDKKPQLLGSVLLYSMIAVGATVFSI